jgi:hypothetical protein
MINDETINQLNIVFSDATLVDIDLSLWDSVVSIYVIADHIKTAVPGKRALIAVRFRGVRRFDWTFRHHNFDKFPLNIDQNHHLNWNIYKMKIVRANVSRLTLSGSEQFPVLKINFEDIDTQCIDHALFGDVNPDWNTSGSGLARPGIERLHALIKKT